METALTAISTVGFPIACCIALALFIKYKDDKTAKEFSEQRAKHEQEIKELRETFDSTVKELKQSIDNNTRVITELIYYLKGGDKNG